MSVRDTAICVRLVSCVFECCSCSVLLVLSNTVPFLCDKLTNLRSRLSEGVVTTLTGIPRQNTNINPARKLAHVVHVE